MVPKAVRAARERAWRAGIEARFLEGDVTALRATGVGSGFHLVLDFGTVHGLTRAQREAVGREVSAVATADATLLYAAAPGRAEAHCRAGRAVTRSKRPTRIGG
jgi:hypothetical protein